MIQKHTIIARLVAPLLAGMLAGCAPAPDAGLDTDGQRDLSGTASVADFAIAPSDVPANARPGACYGKDVTPGVIEHATERVLIAEAEIGPTGNILAPPQYEERKIQKLVTGREPIFFETPCPPRWTPDFIASLQRALKTRGLYAGTATGILDAETRAAIRAFQLDRGLNSAILSTESARALGLVEIDLAG